MRQAQLRGGHAPLQVQPAQHPPAPRGEQGFAGVCMCERQCDSTLPKATATPARSEEGRTRVRRSSARGTPLSPGAASPAPACARREQGIVTGLHARAAVRQARSSVRGTPLPRCSQPGTRLCSVRPAT